MGTDAEIVETIRAASDADLDNWLGEHALSFASLPTCTSKVMPWDPATGAPAGEVLEVSTEGVRTELLSAIWPCIQPLNWPHCNDLFHSVTVVPGSFTTTPTLPAFARVLPGVDLSTVDSIYGCSYVEDVDLPGLVAGLPIWQSVRVRTVLECIEWQRRDANGELTEVGMAYRHSDGDADNEVVDVDEGYAILRLVDPSTAPPTREMTTLKRISFKDTAAIEMLAANEDMCELFCLEWSFNFEVTADDCDDRAVVTASTGRGPVRPACDAGLPREPEGAGTGGPLAGAVDGRGVRVLAAGDIGGVPGGPTPRGASIAVGPVGVGGRLLRRARGVGGEPTLAERRPRAHRAVLVGCDGRPAMSEGTPPRFPKPRPPIDDTEFVDDLRRQDEDFVRGRTAEYFSLYREAADRLSQPGSYTRGSDDRCVDAVGHGGPRRDGHGPPIRPDDEPARRRHARADRAVSTRHGEGSCDVDGAPTAPALLRADPPVHQRARCRRRDGRDQPGRDRDQPQPAAGEAEAGQAEGRGGGRCGEGRYGEGRRARGSARS